MTSRENRLISAISRDDIPELSAEAIVLRVKARETDLFLHLRRRVRGERMFASVIARISSIEG